MRNDEITSRITISISYFRVMDTGAISWGGLGVDWLTKGKVHETGPYLNHHLIGTISVGNEVGLNQ